MGLELKTDAGARHCMIDVDWSVQEAGDVALVAAVVENAAPTPRRVVADPRIDGAVLPPRRRGLPERGWSDGEFAGVVPAEGRLSIGFACRGTLDDPPVVVADEGRASRGASHVSQGYESRASQGGEHTARARDTTPTEVLRDLGSPVPPRDAVPDAVVGARSSEPRRNVTPPDRVARVEPRGTISTDAGASPDVPEPVGDWLDGVATRVDLAERLAERRNLDGAATAVEAVGGLAGVERLVDALGADEAALRAVADRATELAGATERREDVPVDAYRQLA